LLDYHGTPFITRTPWLKENNPPSFNNEYSNLIKNNLTKSTEYIKNIIKNIKPNE
jgi:hypothetical protein